MSLLSQALFSAQSSDSNARTSSHRMLEELSHTNPIGYLVDLSIELTKSSSQSQVRQLAGILIKNLLVNSTKDPSFDQLWQRIEPQIKSQIRNNTLGTLASDDKDVRLVCSQTVATIACLDLPQGQWPDILNILITNATNINQIYKVSAIRTLGYICEGVPQGLLSKAQSDSILTALASSMDTSETDLEIKLVALTAFRNSLKFISGNIANEDERRVIFNLLFSCCQNSSIEVRKGAMLIICDILALYYENLERNLIELGNLTYAIIRNDHESVAMFAIEFWNQAADEEVERIYSGQPVKNYIETAANTLVPLLLEKIHNVEEDDAEWNIHRACASTLASVSLIIHDNILPLVGGYITENLSSENWQKKLSAIVVVGFILEGINNVKDLVNHTLNRLLSLLIDNNKHVIKESASWTISKLCEFHCNYLLTADLLNVILAQLFACLKASAKVATNSCWAIINIFSNSSASSKLTPAQMNCVIDNLIETTLRQDAISTSPGLLEASYNSLIKLIQNLDEIHLPLIIRRTQFFLGLLEASMAHQDQSQIQAYLCEILQAIFGRSPPGSVASDDGHRFVNIMLGIFKQRNTVIEEGLEALGSLSENVGSEFTKYLTLLMPFITWSIENASPSISKGGVMIAGDLSRALGEDFSPYIGQIIPKLLSILSNEQISFEVKVRTIETLADFSSHSWKSLSLYVNEVLKYIESASMLSQNLQLEQNNPDMHEYLLELREAIVSFYVGIAQGMSEEDNNHTVIEYSPRIIEYALLIVQDIYKPTVNIHISVLGLIGDIAGSLGKNASGYLKTANVANYMESLKGNQVESIKQVLIYSQERLSNI